MEARGGSRGRYARRPGSPAILPAVIASRSHVRAAPARVLVGKRFPSLRVLDYGGEQVVFPREVSGEVIVYLYPGADCSPDGGRSSANGDVLQHASFDRHRLDFEARGVRVAGLSSELPKAQFDRIREHRVCHVLWSDPECALAHALDLPTFTQAGKEYYRRGTLIVSGGRIEIAIYPLWRPEQSAVQALWSMKARGM